VKDSSWAVWEPKMSEQIPDQTPELIKNKALDYAHGKHDELVDKAIDKFLETLTKGPEGEDNINISSGQVSKRLMIVHGNSDQQC
jgi:hypothetical protein